MVLDLFSDRFLHRFLYELGFGGGCGSGGKVVHLELVSDWFFHGFLYELGFGGGCGSGGKVMHLEQFSHRFLNGFLYVVVENSGRAPYPTPKLGISARHAVSNLSGCGVGAPNPIGNPAMSKPTQEFRGVGVPPKMSRSFCTLVSGLFGLSRFGTLCFPGLRKIQGLAPFCRQFGEVGEIRIEPRTRFR